MLKPEEVYTGRSKHFAFLVKTKKKQLKRIALFRLMAFIAAIAFLMMTNYFGTFPGITGSFVSVMIFLFFVKQYANTGSAKNHLELLLEINDLELKALNHNYNAFPDGKDYSDPAHPYSYDLDLFGKGSVFQFLNRTTTKYGKDQLAKWLITETINKIVIREKQDMVKELSRKLDTRQNFTATGKQYMDSEEDTDNINAWLSEQDKYFRNKLIQLILVVLPAITITSMFLIILNTGFFNLFLLLFLTQLSISGSQIRHSNRTHELIGKRLEILKKYSRLLSYVEHEDYSSSYLLRMKENLKTNLETSTESINKLSNIISAFDTRLNILAGFLLNGVLLWDIQCVSRLESWKSQFGKNVHKWLTDLGKFDAALSLANFHFNHPGFVFPEISEKTVFEAEKMGHPLIMANERVDNSISIPHEGLFIIITGANMAGKSTFLRSAGVNFVLAKTGAPVCASKFTFKPLALFSSMRTTDSLQKHESYFYAELKRLKEIIDKLRKGDQIFILLDEILKGTNSKDKQTGSRAVLKKIIEKNGTGIIATHDLDLAGMEKYYPEAILNKCFEIGIHEGKMFFDYKLIDGITKKMNASLLMQQMGILEGSGKSEH